MIISIYTGEAGQYSSKFIARFEACGTGGLQERRTQTDNTSPLQQLRDLLSLGSENFTEPVLEPDKNHTPENKGVKGCKQDRILPSILHSKQYSLAPLSLEGSPVLDLHNTVQYNMKQETFKNPATSMPETSLKGEIITAVEENAPLTVSGIAKTLSKPYTEVQPIVQELVDQGKLEISGYRSSRFNRKRPEYQVRK